MPNMSECSFRRVGPPKLVDALKPGGDFHDLVELAKSEPLLDLHVRAFAEDEDKHIGHATLYLGLTQTISLHQRGHRFWLDGPRKTKTFGAICEPYFAEWSKRRFLEDLAAVSSSTKRAEYVARVIKAERNEGQGRWTGKEGELQAALASFPDQLELIDRECVLQHSNTDVRDEWIVDACTPAKAAAKQLGRTKKFGNELDGLAVDAAGRVLVIEAKDGADGPGVDWTPAQVNVYLRLFRRWVNEADAAHADLVAMLDQRRRLGFESTGVSLADPLLLVPVIVIKGPVPDLAGMRAVRSALARQGEPMPDLELWKYDGVSLVRSESPRQ